jgi:O-acetyl-ADP-ribose deacetylase (regulator of RNase III)
MPIVDYKEGDVLESIADFNYIAHGVNCQGVMGGGIALQIKTQYPMTFHKYKKACNDAAFEKQHLLGQIVIDGENKLIHCFTQLYYGNQSHVKYVSYDAIHGCFNRINSQLPGSSIVIPKIGAGLGGGNWEVIARIIDSVTADCSITVFKL